MKNRLGNPAEGFRPTDAQELYIDLKKILLATDGSVAAISATKYAMELAKIFKAKVRAVFVDTSTSQGALSNRTVDEYLKDGESGVPGYHGLVIARICAQNNGVSCEELKLTGSVCKKIIESAEEFLPDLIVLGNSEKSGLKRTLGSIVDAVMKKTDVPVLVVRGS